MTLNGALTIDLDAIAANWRALDALSAPTVETAAVVKADAYGCGAAEVGPALAAAGCRTFFVAHIEEGLALRAALADRRNAIGDPVTEREMAYNPREAIYILNGVKPTKDAWAVCSQNGLMPVLNGIEEIRRAGELLIGHVMPACAAVQIDTGMNRLGMELDEWRSLQEIDAGSITGHHYLVIKMVMSHLACADTPDHPLNVTQLATFNEAHQIAKSARREDYWERLPRSLAATGGILLGPDSHFDLTRPGVGLYGGLPFAAARPAVSLHLPIIQIRDVGPGETVGYGATWAATRPSRIATLSGGYADGLIRALGNRGAGFLDGQPLPFTGRVSMDLITLDVTGCPQATAGAMVEILGPHQTVDDLAAAADTIGYEILTSLGSRYTRRYTGG